MPFQSTHRLEFHQDRVIKRFNSWQNQEPQRERAALELLALHAPDLSPRFLDSGEDQGHPYVVMSRLEGTAAEGALSDLQLSMLASALRELHTSVPSDTLNELPQRVWGRELATEALQRLDWSRSEGLLGPILKAAELAQGWLKSAELLEFRDSVGVKVFAQADGNVGNAVFDGARCRLLDFEDSGWSDASFELADLLEHPSSRLTELLKVKEFIAYYAPSRQTSAQLGIDRKAMAIFWLNLLLPGNPAHHRNPEGSLANQAAHVSALLTR
ncbi:aminoglycoside phosphotransferase (APT) family kinase protein [Psychromicrobium silvestre]|uniref:Aminoglycoside phosphotransferase (APT) family kinase protein n=1 Tax=Psychromicrobium silvestre TaxID=1645614 RepID=A0A7Y9LSB3_9MICC|nr:aminoglycoside phosphotransferase family protein [Psychromicrobium silvestre]NYE94692.1 aminoglycoside phosphotransferase (APT) family kinase protein [Psychromicrobium silvestre]